MNLEIIYIFSSNIYDSCVLNKWMFMNNIEKDKTYGTYGKIFNVLKMWWAEMSNNYNEIVVRPQDTSGCGVVTMAEGRRWWRLS